MERGERFQMYAWLLSLGPTAVLSGLLWIVGGYSACGMESGDVPSGSVRDSLCTTLVEPTAPWLVLSAAPVLLSSAMGLVALRTGRDSLLLLASWLPLVLACLAILAWLAL
jgi:hypothetical protein